MIEQSYQYWSGSFSLHTFGILSALIALEAVLSADNAVALAALAQEIPDPKKQQQALNWGMLGAFMLRIFLLLTASWVMQFWQFELLGGLYLLWLAGKHFLEKLSSSELDSDSKDVQPLSSFWRIIVLIAITDLAFSVDSVTAAVALSNQLWIVLTGTITGIILLRFLAGLFVSWLVKFSYLQDAAYLTVLGVGLRLLTKATLPDYAPPDWVVIMSVIIFFAWGFSKRVLPTAQPIEQTTQPYL